MTLKRHYIYKMHWCYILRFGEKVYVGETTRLFQRFNEHCSGKTIQIDCDVDELLAIYKLEDEEMFLNFDENSINYKMYKDGYQDIYWNLESEKQLASMCMKYYDTYSNIKNTFTKTPYRPYCKCNLPADIKLYNDKKYWRCAKKNFYDSLYEFLDEKNIDYSEPCNFYKVQS